MPENVILLLLIIAGYRKKDEACKPLQFSHEETNLGFNISNTASRILIAWRNSGLSGLTKETFTACIQSIQAMTYLAQYLINQHAFSYVLPGKFCSDPIEGRFGWYRQVNGGNFFMSINQLFQAEKKIRCLSLIEKEIMFRPNTLASHPNSIQSEVGDDPG